jgi:predicted RNase H-like nuclease (RuvC/YqgF family)
MYLASRSNYQIIIDGAHVPGVTYPQELSTNLTSKRTSHKIAEQGRRNRINTALQEMLKLIPRGSSQNPNNGSQSPGAEDEVVKKGDLATNSSKSNGNSKAATVESAIEYIKSLKEEREEMSRAAEQKDRECEELRRRLEDMQKLVGQNGKSPLGGEGDDKTT